MIKSFENTILQVLTSTEKTNNKFVEWLGKVQIEHFKQLEKQSAKDREVFESSIDKFLSLLQEKQKEKIDEEVIRKLSSLDEVVENSIEKEERIDNPLEDFPQMDMSNIKVQMEGEEEIYPLNIE